MRPIDKGPEPTGLLAYRQKLGGSYGDGDKAEIRTALVNEQRELCCYCLSRIADHRKSTKIEHWANQADNEALTLDYKNMLGSCYGSEHLAPDVHHCDKSRKDMPLTINPSEPSHRARFRIGYLGNGEIYSTETKVDHELKNVLKLNQRVLVNNRKARLEAFQRSLPRKALKAAELEKHLAAWDGSSKNLLPEYSEVVVHWILKKLRRK